MVAAISNIRRLLVVVPNWVGDVVLATPVLAALRAHFQTARITFLLRAYVAEVLAGGDWHDEFTYWPTERGLVREWRMLRLARRLRAERFELALLLTNSFRSAWVVWHARIPRRVGYDRDARGWLLTDRLHQVRENGRFVPTPVLSHYIRLAEYVGCQVADRRLRLATTAAQEQAGRELLRRYGLEGQPYAVVNPGAAFGSAKCWLPERFAALCDWLREEVSLRPVLIGSPGEYPLLRAIAGQARGPVVCCDQPGTTLGTLKVLIRQAALLIGNDTGPRHYGNAFGVPTVTIFGPTHQAWTDTDYDGEIKLQVPVECGPCQLRACPLDLRCMTELTTGMVKEAVLKLLAKRQPVGVA